MSDSSSEYRSIFQVAKSYWTGAMDERRRAYCRAWLSRRMRATYGTGTSFYMWFHVVSLVIDPLFIDKAYSLMVLQVTHAVSLVLFLVAIKLFGATAWVSAPMALLAPTVTMLGYAELVRYYTVELQAIDIVILRAWTGFICVTIFQIVYWPGFNPIVRLGMCLSAILCAAYAWSASPSFMRVFPIAVFMVFAAFFANFMGVLRAIAESMRDFDHEEVLLMAEQAKHRAEMEMTRRIHDSMSMPITTDWGSIQVHCYRSTQSVVGGDWAATRSDQSGALYLLVCDAAGKGTQAALVIHAVQSIWADSLTSEVFEPFTWIERLGAALCRMGSGEAHMVTLGLVKILGHTLTYWSAGHLPLFIVTTTAEGTEKIQTVHRANDPLGISMQAQVTPASFTLPEDGNFELLLGTDGVFHDASTLRPRGVAKIIQRLRDKGPEILVDFPDDDDRTLLWAKKRRENLNLSA